MSKFLSILVLSSFILILLPENVDAAYYSADLEAINIGARNQLRKRNTQLKMSVSNHLKVL